LSGKLLDEKLIDVPSSAKNRVSPSYAGLPLRKQFFITFFWLMTHYSFLFTHGLNLNLINYSNRRIVSADDNPIPASVLCGTVNEYIST